MGDRLERALTASVLLGLASFVRPMVLQRPATGGGPVWGRTVARELASAAVTVMLSSEGFSVASIIAPPLARARWMIDDGEELR